MSNIDSSTTASRHGVPIRRGQPPDDLFDAVLTSTIPPLMPPSSGDPDQSSTSGWIIALVIVTCIVIVVASAIGAYFLYKRIRRMRKNHGEYKPQAEENLYAKSLPYINPPNINGLI